MGISFGHGQKADHAVAGGKGSPRGTSRFSLVLSCRLAEKVPDCDLPAWAGSYLTVKLLAG